ncbi:hypothetical protein PPERSA_02337 [Pseudocohnilembus persalinus]|uniref:Uncharacterized protein n=1 Tax=Pseudocohnilembus persalinus TaxID=266149 RepID=A0A0V0QUM0_PSEPJ|nr:hypothetical protein PPERSA_02337 [Pseudocohnilembus persalinus]|eukprot:KRX05805.1 hypothetical protein PPERSA_02337 [Pseudocohnilembus persalinus]
MDTKNYKNNNNKIFNNNQFDKNEQKVHIIEKSQDQNNITIIQKNNINQNVKQKLYNDNISKSGKSDETSIIQNNQNQNTEETSYNLDNINIHTQNYNYNKSDKLYLEEQKSNSSSNNQILYEYDEDETNTNNQNNQKNQHNTLPKSFMQQILQLSEKGSFQLQNFSSNQDEFELYPDQNDEKQQIKELQAKLEVFGKLQEDEENKSVKKNQNLLTYKQNIKPTNKPLMSMQNKNDEKKYEGLKLNIEQQNSQLKSMHQIQNKKVVCKKSQQDGKLHSQKEIKQQKPIKSYTQFNCLYTQPQHESKVVSLQEIDNFDSQIFKESQGQSLLQDLSYFKQNGFNGFEKKTVYQKEQCKNHQYETEIDKNGLNQSDIQLDQEEQNHEPKANKHLRKFMNPLQESSNEYMKNQQNMQISNLFIQMPSQQMSIVQPTINQPLQYGINMTQPYSNQQLQIQPNINLGTQNQMQFQNIQTPLNLINTTQNQSMFGGFYSQFDPQVQQRTNIIPNNNNPIIPNQHQFLSVLQQPYLNKQQMINDGLLQNSVNIQEIQFPIQQVQQAQFKSPQILQNQQKYQQITQGQQNQSSQQTKNLNQQESQNKIRLDALQQQLKDQNLNNSKNKNIQQKIEEEQDEQNNKDPTKISIQNLGQYKIQNLQQNLQIQDKNNLEIQQPNKQKYELNDEQRIICANQQLENQNIVMKLNRNSNSDNQRQQNAKCLQKQKHLKNSLHIDIPIQTKQKKIQYTDSPTEAIKTLMQSRKYNSKIREKLKIQFDDVTQKVFFEVTDTDNIMNKNSNNSQHNMHDSIQSLSSIKDIHNHNNSNSNVNTNKVKKRKILDLIGQLKNIKPDIGKINKDAQLLTDNLQYQTYKKVKKNLSPLKIQSENEIKKTEQQKQYINRLKKQLEFNSYKKRGRKKKQRIQNSYQQFDDCEIENELQQQQSQQQANNNKNNKISCNILKLIKKEEEEEEEHQDKNIQQIQNQIQIQKDNYVQNEDETVEFSDSQNDQQLQQQSNQQQVQGLNQFNQKKKKPQKKPQKIYDKIDTYIWKEYPLHNTQHYLQQ